MSDSFDNPIVRGARRRGRSAPAALALATAIAVAPVATGAATLPELKAGLWESRITSHGLAGAQPMTTTTRMCLDAATQREMFEEGPKMAAGACRKSDLRVDGRNRYVIEADCTIQDSRMRSRSVITLAGRSAYRMEAVGTFDPPMMGMKQNRTVVEGKHLGACPKGMKPGDIAIGGMPPMNVRQMGAPGSRDVPKK